MRSQRHLIASLTLVAVMTTLVGCDTKALTQAANNFANSEQGKSLIHQAALALKAMDEEGVALAYGEDDILKVMLGDKEITPKFDANGQLLLEVEPGKEQDLVVELKDGQRVNMPFKAEQADFKGNKPPQFQAFVMPGVEKNLYGEMIRPGENKTIHDVFKGKAVRVDIDRQELQNEKLRRLYIGQFSVPRHTFFVEDGDLMLHASNLWVMARAKGIQIPPPGGQQPGGMQPPPPGGMQPPPMPAFSVAQMQPPPPPPPGGQMQPPPGGDKPLVFHLLYEVQEGKFAALAITASKVPGPPPPPQPGQNLVSIAQNPPSVNKGDITAVTALDVADLGKFEAEVVRVQTGGSFLPPPPPMHRPGGQQPGGMQPPPPPPGGTQPR